MRRTLHSGELCALLDRKYVSIFLYIFVMMPLSHPGALYYRIGDVV